MLTTESVYQTTCYQCQGNELVNAQNCTVTLVHEHPENGLDWEIMTLSGEVYHYRNLGVGIEIWSHITGQWTPVEVTDWFQGKEGVLCWDNFCANWQEIPLD